VQPLAWRQHAPADDHGPAQTQGTQDETATVFGNGDRIGHDHSDKKSKENSGKPTLFFSSNLLCIPAPTSEGCITNAYGITSGKPVLYKKFAYYLLYKKVDHASQHLSAYANCSIFATKLKNYALIATSAPNRRRIWEKLPLQRTHQNKKCFLQQTSRR
jgi:hypothetical protein